MARILLSLKTTTYKGIKLQFTCAHQQDGCIAECEWSSLGIVLRDGQYHVVFSITFKSDLDTVLNKHIHPQGCQAHSSKTFPDIPECCQIVIEILPAPFKAFATRAVNKVIHKGVANHIRTSMLSILHAFEEDPIAFQSGLNITSYNRARNLKQKERTENMPWLEGKNLGTDKMGQRLLELMHYTNNIHWEKEKHLGTFEAKKKYPYFIASVKEDAHGLTVILTDL